MPTIEGVARSHPVPVMVVCCLLGAAGPTYAIIGLASTASALQRAIAATTFVLTALLVVLWGRLLTRRGRPSGGGLLTSASPYVMVLGVATVPFWALLPDFALFRIAGLCHRFPTRPHLVLCGPATGAAPDDRWIQDFIAALQVTVGLGGPVCLGPSPAWCHRAAREAVVTAISDWFGRRSMTLSLAVP